MEQRPVEPPETGQPARRPLSSGSEFAGIGLQLGATFALSAWLGYWLDRKFGTLPWLTLVCVFIGAGAAFFSVYRRVIGSGKR